MNCDTDEKAEEKLWHYMSLEKCLWLLKDKQPYFRNLIALRRADEREGMIPPWLQRLVDYARTQKEFDERPREVSKPLEAEANRSYVFCWNKDECESSLMWAAYGDNGKGVCLQTTRNKMLGLPVPVGPRCPFSIYACEVDYIDHNDQSSSEKIYERLKPQYSLAQFKSREFKWENELRMVAVLASENFEGDPVKQTEGKCFPVGGAEQKLDKVLNKFVWEFKFNEALEKLIAGPRMDPKTFAFLKELVEREFPVRFEFSSIAQETQKPNATPLIGTQT